MEQDGAPTSSLRSAIALRARLLVLAFAAFSFLGLLGNTYWLFELFSHFIAWCAVGTCVLVVVLWCCRAKWWAVVAFLLALLQSFLPLSWYLPPEQLPSEGPADVRILLANVHSGNQNTEALLARVSEWDPDIVCVQEVSDHWQDALSPLEALYPVHMAVPRSDNFGIAIYSRMAGAQPELIIEESGGVPAIALRFEANGRDVRLLNLHAVPPVGGALAARRDEQLSFVRRWFDAQPGPAVLIGDLNLTMYSPVYRQLVAGAGITNARRGHGPIGTWPAWLPVLRLPIDHCLVRGVEVLDCSALKPIGSDHLPLLVTLRLSE